MLRIDRWYKWVLSSRAQVLLGRRAEDVFNVLTDVSSWAEWRTPVHVEMTSDGPLRIGSTFNVSHLLGPEEQEVTELVPSARIVYEPKIWSGGLRRRTTFEVEPVNGGTRVTQTSEILHFGLYYTLFLVLFFAFLAAALAIIFFVLALLLFRWLSGRELGRNLLRIENVRLPSVAVTDRQPR